MRLPNSHPQPSRDLSKRLMRSPMLLYQLGWDPLLNWLPLLILTTKGRKTELPRYAVVEYRRHGSKYYIVSGWGATTDWHRNIQQDPRVTIQHGPHIYDALAQPVENPAEALRAVYLFTRNSWLYQSFFARMTSTHAADLSALADVAEEFTVLRLELTEQPPALPPIDKFSPAAQQIISMATLFIAWRLIASILRHTRAKGN